MQVPVNEILKFIKWVDAIAPALFGIYQVSRGNSKVAIELLKRSYQATRQEQLAQWQKKGGKRPNDEDTEEHKIPTIRSRPK